MSGTKRAPIVWLASYPRCGNTLLRTILWHCFGLRSGSIYPGDLGNNPALEEYVGHVRQDPPGSFDFPAQAVLPIKTHEPPPNQFPAIYSIRDGRAAAVSLWKFYNRTLSIDEIAAGNHRFGAWGQHVRAWSPWTRPGTLLVRYEDMVDSMGKVVEQIETFFSLEAVRHTIPDRGLIADADGRWVKRRTDWRTEAPGAWLAAFEEANRVVLEKAGYM